MSERPGPRRINLSALRKLEASSVTRPDADADAVLEAVVRVSVPGYVPAGLTVRARLDDTMFTCTLKSGLLAALERDPRVSSISLGKRLRGPEQTP